MRLILAIVALALFLSSAQAAEWRQTFEWRVGVAYASGVGDVTDLYEENLRLSGLEADVDLKFPLGIAAGMTYDWASGMRADVSLGPTFFIGGETEHFELPLGVTLGYNFMRDADASPYVRGGVIHHFASGDYDVSSNPGLFVAAGLDFTRFTIEVALDNSEVEFEAADCAPDGTMCRPTIRTLNTYEFIAGVFWRFR